MLALLLLGWLGAVPQASADSLLVSPGWLAAHRDDPGLVVLAVGMERADYDAGHIPSARFVPLMDVHSHDGMLDAGHLTDALVRAGVSTDSRVVIYGDGIDTSPGILFVALEYVGLGDRTSVLDGGLTAWRAAGLSISTQAPPPRAGRLVPRPSDDMIVRAPWVRAHLEDPGTLFLDTRAAGEYTGAEPLANERRGHLPGAALVEWNRTIDQGSDRLRPLDELQRLFREAGAAPETTIVTYCLVGMRASHVYFVSRLLGYPTRIYVGSMADWSSRPAAEHPLVSGPTPRSP